MKPIVRIVVGLASASLVTAAQETIQVDFRTYIPGVLDAPVFYPDGVTRIAYKGDGEFQPRAMLFYSKEEWGGRTSPPVLRGVSSKEARMPVTGCRS